MNDIRNMLVEAGCVLEGEFFFALKKRGLVSKKYINLDPVLTDPLAVKTISEALTANFAGRYTCLVGPAVGGIPLIYAAALAELENQSVFSFSNPNNLRTVFAEKDGDGFKFDRMGFARAVKGRQVLVLEDISSTGDTTGKVCRLVAECGGNVMGVSLIWNRGNITASTLQVPILNSLVTEAVETWWTGNYPPGWGELPLVSDIGHPEYFPDYPGPRIKLLA